jgi:FtsP/CotA-like multicopper oxidase with cupredoxin domain
MSIWWCLTGKTYRIRVHNVGISTSLNFRIQNHNLLLAEAEGSYTVQQNYTSLDIHVGQSYSFLVTMDQNASSDYYIVASARFVNESRWQRVTGVGILHYTNSKGKAKGHLPPGPDDQFDKTFSMNQARSIRYLYAKILEHYILSCLIYSCFSYKQLPEMYSFLQLCV